MSQESDLQQLIRLLPDHESEMKVAPLLRELPEVERLQIINSLIASNSTITAGFRLAVRVLDSKECIDGVIHKALAVGNVSNIDHWVRPFIQRVGYRRFLVLLRQYLQIEPQATKKVRYWLGAWFLGADETIRQQVTELAAGFGSNPATPQ